MILITAFEPFGDAATNITQEIISILPPHMGNIEIITTCLPVSFERAPIALQQAIAQHQPDKVLLLGQCPRGDYIRLERLSINLMDACKGDNDGYIPNEETIYEGAPMAYLTPMSIKTIARQCQENNLPITISNSAGLYVCNRVYYEALFLDKQALFVHIPNDFDIQYAVRIITYILDVI